MNSVYNAYELFGVSAPDTTSILEKSFLKSSNLDVSVSTRFTCQTFFREGFDFYHSEEAIQLGRDYLQGCYSDYFFIQGDYSTNTTDYYLFVGDIDFDGSVISLNEADGYLFRYQNIVGDVYRSSRQGTLNFPSLAIVNGSGSSSSTPSHSENFSFQFPVAGSYNSNLSVFRSSVSGESIELDSSGSLQSFMYSSFSNTPHLIEGVQNYAYAGFLVCGAVVAFSLADRLFRRLH